jgi:NitT/TauT family transport system permease protein
MESAELTTARAGDDRPRSSPLADRDVQGMLFKVGSAVVLLLVWWLASLTLPQTILPGPVVTFQTLWQNFERGLLLPQLGITMLRVASGFVLAMAIGITVGTLMGLYWKAEAALDLWVMVALTIPGLCYIIVSFMWFGLNEWAAIFAIAAASFPSIAINVWEGVKNVDNRLADMARVFKASRRMRLTRVIMPQILPFVMAASRFGLGTIWKVTVLVELLGRSSGVGYQLHYWFQLYNMPQVFAWTLFFTLIMLFLELVVLKQAENRLFAWRPSVKF